MENGIEIIEEKPSRKRLWLIPVLLAVFAAAGLGWYYWCYLRHDELPSDAPEDVKWSTNGIDVSHHQDSIDWTAVANDRNADISFVYIKATEGKTHDDKCYKHNAVEAKNAGLHVGLYHYFNMISTPEDQFEHFKKALDDVEFDLIPLVDVEAFNGKTGEQLVANLTVFLNLVEKEYGVKPMIYTVKGVYRGCLKKAFPDYQYYLASYTTMPPKETYLIWQYTEGGKVEGIKKDVDCCRFHPEHSLNDILMPSEKRISKRDAANTPKLEVQRDTFSTLSKKIVDVIETDSLRIYYPNGDSIDLRFGTMPDKDLDSKVIFCCEGAYTGDCLDNFRHENIAGDHVSSGVRYNGYPCTRNTGAFVWYKGKWKFLYQNYSYELDSAAMNGGMGYGQEMLIHEDTIRTTVRGDDNVNVFRALCEVDGKLCIIDSKTKVAFGEFKRMCLKYGAKEAIYLDMGAGWNHSWYRNDEGKVIEIYPKTKISRYCTNWLTFYR